MFVETHLLLFLLLVGLLTGFVKSGLPPLGSFVSVVMVSVFPPKDAIGMTLLLFLFGDILAATFHWKKANKAELLRLFPTILIGIFTGMVIVNLVDSDVLGLIIGCVITFLVCLEPYRERISQWALSQIRWVRLVSGWLAGIATTIGNVSGPLLSLYFLLLKLDKRSLAGTSALFFLSVNLVKLPLFSMSGIIKPEYFPSLLAVAPLVIVGSFLGRRFIQWIPQKQFTQVILVVTGLAGCSLIARYLWL